MIFFDSPHALTEAPILPDQKPLDLTDVRIVEAPLSESPLTATATAPYTTTFITPNENPFSLTDGEIDEMLRVLEEGSVPANRSPVDIVYDEDLGKVLNMDIKDFTV